MLIILKILFSPLQQQQQQFGMVVMPCKWKDKHRSDVRLAMSHKLIPYKINCKTTILFPTWIQASHLPVPSLGLVDNTQLCYRAKRGIAKPSCPSVRIVMSRWADCGDLFVLQANVSISQRSFSIVAPVVWNTVLPDLHSPHNSRRQFRFKLKTHLFRQAHNTAWFLWEQCWRV